MTRMQFILADMMQKPSADELSSWLHEDMTYWQTVSAAVWT